MPGRRAAAHGRLAVLAVVACGLLVLLAVGALAWRGWTRAPYEEALAAWKGSGDAPAALTALERGAKRPGLEGPESELRGIVQLALGDVHEAELAFARARETGGAGSDRQASLIEAGRGLLAEGREDALPTLVDYGRVVLQPAPPELEALAGFSLHARGDLAGAREAYKAARDAGVAGEWKEEVDRMFTAAAEQARSGRVPVVLARGGEVLAWRDARTRQLVAGPELQALLGGAGVESLPGLSAADLDGLVELTLDADLQRRAARVYRNETGAFVGLSIPDGEILAAASEAEPPFPLVPFAPAFQPGSTLKVLTMAAWLEEGLPDDLVVPYDCKGNDFKIDGEILYDWSAHGRLESLERALSQSCNTVFARMGLELGEARLRDELRPFGFGASHAEGAGDTEGEGFELAGGGRARSGALAAGPLDEKRLARTAMVLDETRMSALQAAVIALVLADGGELPAPRLVRRKLNLLGEELPSEPGPAPRRVLSPETAARVAKAMESVVNDPDGTGRGARSAGVPVALKTGTTGGDGNPLSSAFVGFLPAGRPQLAFGMFTRDSGRSLDVSRRVLGPFLEEAWSELSSGGARTN